MVGKITYKRKLVGTELVDIPVYTLDGAEVSKKEFDRATKPKRCGVAMTAPAGNWPVLSDAAGVDPTQIREASENAKKYGVPTEFNRETGQAIFTSPGHRKAYCRLYGLADNNAGYGDPAPQRR